MDQEKTYTIDYDEDDLEFIRRVIAEQPDHEPLRIVELLVEIALGELKGRPCDISAAVSEERMKVTIRHNGKQIDGRMIRVLGDFTDRVDYHPDGDNDHWVLTIRRDVPPPFVTRHHNEY